MKKILLSVAVLATVVSCSKNEETLLPQGDANAIGFATLNDRITKAANDTGADYQVYARASTATSSWLIAEAVYGATEVVESEGTPSFNADEIKSGVSYYWPTTTTTTVDFYAFSPLVDTENGPLKVTAESTISAATPTIPLTFTVPTAADVDFTVATPVLAAQYGTVDATNGQGSVSADGKVTLPFTHMLAKASLTVALETDLATGNNFTFTSASFTVAKNIVTTNAVMVKDATPTSTVGGESATYAYSFTGLDTAGDSFTATNSLFFAPKAAGELEASGYSISIKGATITADNDDKTVLLPATDLTYTIPDATAFEQGKEYDFVVTIKANSTQIGLYEITFTSSASWGDGDGDGTALN